MRTQDLSENKQKKSKIRQSTGMKIVAGVQFFGGIYGYVADIGPVKLTLNDKYCRCSVTDTRDGYSIGFNSVTAAKLFAKRRTHGRTIDEHMRAEKLKYEQERNDFSLEEMAEIISVSPRTLEAYYSGRRVIPCEIIDAFKLL